MIDYAVLVLHNVSWGEYIKLVELIDVVVPPESNRMVTYFENLRLEYYPNSNQLKMKNSLHKFFNRTLADVKIDGNYNDFRFSDFYVLCGFFSELYLRRDLKDFKLSTKFETGLNIDCGGY